MTEIENKITDYLASGGLFNPEFMEHDKVRDLLIDCRKEIQRLSEKCDRQAMILRRLNPETYPDTYFISGEYGPKDPNGLPEKICVVPAYGLDWHMIYERTEKTQGPEW